VQHPLLCTALQAAAVHRLPAPGGGGLPLSGRVEKTTVSAPDEQRGADPSDRPAQISRCDSSTHFIGSLTSKLFTGSYLSANLRPQKVWVKRVLAGNLNSVSIVDILID